MMQKFMGDENFALGLENYIAKHKYGNAYMVDLFDALNSVSEPYLLPLPTISCLVYKEPLLYMIKT